MHEAVKRAEKLLLYRVNGGGVKASCTVGGLEAEALRIPFGLFLLWAGVSLLWNTWRENK